VTPTVLVLLTSAMALTAAPWKILKGNHLLLKEQSANLRSQSMTRLLTALHRIAEEMKALHPSLFSTDIRQRSTECITRARSYNALFQPVSAITGKAFREANNSRITSNANIPILAIT